MEGHSCRYMKNSSHSSIEFFFKISLETSSSFSSRSGLSSILSPFNGAHSPIPKVE
ncbi:hypothetical protein MYP_786 [Sporocytophaga myxococcoides]|uniref:Uncharacterized protein n=1 Tax=Sporocytophaga myxococcoides TaxID=153721 RepID=A0A098LAT1_9BACT|nr:hypothetical protein MYP_786 [Sporocytophaga myxococcoides]